MVHASRAAAFLSSSMIDRHPPTNPYRRAACESVPAWQVYPCIGLRKPHSPLVCFREPSMLQQPRECRSHAAVGGHLLAVRHTRSLVLSQSPAARLSLFSLGSWASSFLLFLQIPSSEVNGIPPPTPSAHLVLAVTCRPLSIIGGGVNCRSQSVCCSNNSFVRISAAQFATRH